jgi:hypothetical protein
MRRTLLTVALSLLIAGPAAAQQPLKLSFQNGRVTVEAQAVPVRTILNEWSKIGGTKVVGAERISGAPLTLKLVNVPEAQALEIILRSAAGYMAAPRNIAAVMTGPSMYDRILVMATTSAPPPTANRTTPVNNAFNGTQRFVPPRPPQRPEQQEQIEQEEPDENPPNPPVFTFPQNGQQTQPFGTAPVVQPQINGNYPAPISINPAQAPGQTMPFGASTPGMIVQPPQPVPPGTKPPGGK